MAEKEAKNARGDTILVEDGNDAKHPSGQPAKKADKVAGPYIEDAEPNDPPVRTNRPDVPVLNVLGTGAGEHVTPQDKDPHIGADGRYYADKDEAEAASAEYAPAAAPAK